jgi:hypothetical protein
MQRLPQAENSGEFFLPRAGIYLLAFATVVAGLFDLMWGDFDSAHQPIQAFGDHIPGREVMAYITGFGWSLPVWRCCGAEAPKLARQR